MGEFEFEHQLSNSAYERVFKNVKMDLKEDYQITNQQEVNYALHYYARSVKPALQEILLSLLKNTPFDDSIPRTHEIRKAVDAIRRVRS